MTTLVFLLTLLLLPLGAGAQVTWTQLNVLDPDNPSRVLRFEGVASGGEFVVDGQRRAFRRDAVGGLAEILCPNLPPPNPLLRLSPDIAGINAGLTVVGSEVVGSSPFQRIVGVIQEPSGGNCAVVAPPATVNTWLTALNALGYRAGYTQRPNVNLGLRRFQGFTQAPDGTITYLGGVCNVDDDGTTMTADVMYPDAMSDNWTVGHAQCNLKPNNTYRHEAWFCQTGIGCQLLRDPNGNPLMLTAVTNTGIAYGYTAPDAFVSGGPGWICDLNTQACTPAPLPPPTTPGGTVESFEPRAASETAFLGLASERRANCPPPGQVANCLVTSQWLGVPDGPVRIQGDGRRRDKDKEDRKRHEEREKKGGPR